MTPRFAVFLLLCAARVSGEDPVGLDQPLTSSRAKQLRRQAQALWKQAAPVWERSRGKEPLEPAAIVKAVADIEAAVFKFERSLQTEWHAETNTDLASAVRAWFALHPRLPPPAEPKTEEERAKLAKKAERERRKRLKDARRFVLDAAGARKFRNQFVRCPRCDGRTEIPWARGEMRPCPSCKRAGHLVHRKGVLKARWLPKSPLFRAAGRNASTVNRLLRNAQGRSEVLAPFVAGVTIRGKPEDHDVWVRFKVEEKTYAKPGSKKIERTKTSYVAFRVGRVWYLYDERSDKKILEIPAAEE